MTASFCPVTTKSGLAEVDSLDEVLFMMRRDQILRHPLSEEADLSWHAYAVEYGARLRSMGYRVAVANIPLTHNSLTINLDRLAEAHQVDRSERILISCRL